MNWKFFLDVFRYQCWKFRADSTRYHWCIISCSFSSDRNYPRKGTVSPHSSHFQTTCYFLTNFFLTHLQALNSPTPSYSFNFEEYIDEEEISSSAISSKEALSDEIKNRLKDMLPMLKKNIANLVQDADPVRRTFLAIKGNLPLNLAKVLTPLSNIEDQAPRVKRA